MNRGWIIKECEDEYDFEMDTMNLESMDIFAFTDPERRIIEVPYDEDDPEKLASIYDLLFPGFMEDVQEMMEREIEDPYSTAHFYKDRMTGV